MLKFTLLTSDGQITRSDFNQKDLGAAYLLDNLRGAMSFGNKAFALVEHTDGKLEYAVIIGNDLAWLSPAEFFSRVNIASSLE